MRLSTRTNRMLYLDEACSRNTPNLTLAMLTRQALHWDGINLEEVPPVRADIDEEPRADDPGDAVRDILGRDDPFARAVLPSLHCGIAIWCARSRVRSCAPATERLANWITQTDARSGPTGHT